MSKVNWVLNVFSKIIFTVLWVLYKYAINSTFKAIWVLKNTCLGYVGVSDKKGNFKALWVLQQIFGWLKKYL